MLFRSADRVDVFSGVVLIAGSPSRDDFPHRVQLVPLDVVPQYNKRRPDAPFHFRKLFKGVVSRLTDLTLPVIPHPDVQWVVVSNSPWNLVLS